MSAATAGKNHAFSEEKKKPANIHEAFLNVCAGVSNVKRSATGQVGQQKYKYATLESVLDMVNPLLEENDLALIQYVDDDTLRAVVLHKSGEKLPLGGYNLGSIGKHQERGSAITYGRRYQLCAIFGITQEDDDGAAASQTKKSVFSNASKRKQWVADQTKLIEGSPDLEELRAIWSDIMPVLQEMKDSADEYDQMTYDHMLQLKGQHKRSLEKLNG